MEAKIKKVYTFSKWGLKITAKNDIIAEIAKYVHLNNEGRTRPLPFMVSSSPFTTLRVSVTGSVFVNCPTPLTRR